MNTLKYELEVAFQVRKRKQSIDMGQNYHYWRLNTHQN